MKKALSWLLLAASILCTLAGCSFEKQPENGITPDGENREENSAAAPVAADFSQNDEDMFTDRDSKQQYDDNNAVSIQLNGDSAAASSDGVQTQ